MDPKTPYSEALAARAAELATKCVHAGEEPDPSTGALDPPIVLSSAFGFESADEAAGAFRKRERRLHLRPLGKPDRRGARGEARRARRGRGGGATASGMAAISGAILSLCESGSHIVAPRAMYAESARLLRERLPRFGITTTFVDALDAERLRARDHARPRASSTSRRRRTRTSAITDIESVVGLAKAHGLVTIADNTFATPFAQTPLALGVDLVVHSMTKALGGHGDAIGGAICGARALVDRATRSGREGLRRGHLPLHRVPRSRAGCARSPSASARRARPPRRSPRASPSTRASRASITRPWPRIPATRRALVQMHAFGSLLSFELRGRGRREARSSAGGACSSGVKIDHPRGEPGRRPLAPHPPRLDDALDHAAEDARDGRHLGRAPAAERRHRVGGRPVERTWQARLEDADDSASTEPAPLAGQIRANGGRSMDRLVVVGARQHNLKNVSCRLPRGKIVVFTGPSGSGKSSLAFDTIYAEGQRRYVESLSAYARQFLEQLAKPDVERIEGLSPGHRHRAAPALEVARARPSAPSPRSPTTCASSSPASASRTARTAASASRRRRSSRSSTASSRSPEATRAVASSRPSPRARKGELKLELERLRREGFVRARIDGSVVDLGDEIELDRTQAARPRRRRRSPRRSRRASRGASPTASSSRSSSARGASSCRPGEDEPFWMSERFACVDCGISLPPIEPRMFSFNGPHGACPACDGLGARDVGRSRARASATRAARCAKGVGARVGPARVASRSRPSCRARSTRSASSPDVPWAKLPETQRQAILFGDAARAARRERNASAAAEARARQDEGVRGHRPAPRAAPRRAADVRVEDERRRRSGRGRGRHRRRRARALPRHAHLRRLQGQAPAARGARGEARRQGHRPGRRACRSARVRELRRARSGDGDGVATTEPFAAARARHRRAAAQGRRRAPRLPHRRRARLPRARPQRADALVAARGSASAWRRRSARRSSASSTCSTSRSVGLHARDNARLIEAQAPPARPRQHASSSSSTIARPSSRADHVVDMGPGAGVHGGEVVAQGTPRRDHGEPASRSPGRGSRARRQLPIPSKRRRADQGARPRRRRARAQPAAT